MDPSYNKGEMEEQTVTLGKTCTSKFPLMPSAFRVDKYTVNTLIKWLLRYYILIVHFNVSTLCIFRFIKDAIVFCTYFKVFILFLQVPPPL